jgi:hypothetical protein
MAKRETVQFQTFKVIYPSQSHLQYSEFHSIKIVLPILPYLLEANVRIIPQADHNSFLPNPFKFFSYHSSYYLMLLRVNSRLSGIQASRTLLQLARILEKIYRSSKVNL